MKIVSIEEMADTVGRLRSSGKKIVHCHGVFDLLHIGHIRHFDQARRFGDILVVTVTPDRFVDKGPHRPAFPEKLRAEALASLRSVDLVAINPWPTAEDTLRLLRPHVYVKGSEFKKPGSDMTRKIDQEAQVAKEIGAELAFTDDIVFSSTNLINRHLSSLPEEMNEYLGILRQRVRMDAILSLLDRMGPLRVLVVGDTILDEYQYCEPMGKSNKDPALTALYQSRDLFAGGALAVANHVAGFADEVHLISVLGEKDSQESFIRSQLLPNVRADFAYQPGAPTLIKRRFVDGYSFNKLFELYVMDDSGLPEDHDRALCRLVADHMKGIDLIIMADYGHGAVSEAMVRTACEGGRFLAVNTQANSGNRGFHTVTRYPRADYVCIAEHEIRLEMRKRNGRIEPMMTHLAEILGTTQFVVTRGRKGCLVLNRHGEFVAVPAFAEHVVDRVGAGDAFFAVTALASALHESNEIIGFLGNVAGCLAVGTLGNKKPIDKMSMKKNIVSLVK